MAIFYQRDVQEGINKLSEEESRHCTLVLRRKAGDEITVFDGNGGKHHAILTHITKKACEFEVVSSEKAESKHFSVNLGIAPTKNADRMEWLIEKLAELGIDEVTFIQTHNSERRKLRLDRLEKKAISAMKQSGNPFLLKINPLVDLESFVENSDADIKLIAHVDKTNDYLTDLIQPKKRVSVLIGPEGDFSPEEITKTKKCGFKAGSLGQNVLRTETAGFVACCLINNANRF